MSAKMFFVVAVVFWTIFSIASSQDAFATKSNFTHLEHITGKKLGVDRLRNFKASNKVRASVVTFRKDAKDFVSFLSTGALLTLRHAVSSANPICEFEERTGEVFVLTGVYQHGPRCAEQKYGIVKIDFNRREMSKYSDQAEKHIAIATLDREVSTSNIVSPIAIKKSPFYHYTYEAISIRLNKELQYVEEAFSETVPCDEFLCLSTEAKEFDNTVAGRLLVSQTNLLGIAVDVHGDSCGDYEARFSELTHSFDEVRNWLWRELNDKALMPEWYDDNEIPEENVPKDEILWENSDEEEESDSAKKMKAGPSRRRKFKLSSARKPRNKN